MRLLHGGRTGPGSVADRLRVARSDVGETLEQLGYDGVDRDARIVHVVTRDAAFRDAFPNELHALRVVHEAPPLHLPIDRVLEVARDERGIARAVGPDLLGETVSLVGG